MTNFFSWLDSQSGYSLNTCSAYKNDMRRFIHWMDRQKIGSSRAVEVNAQALQSFFDHESQSGLSLRTAMRRQAALRCFTRYLKLVGVWDGDSIRLPGPHQDGSIPLARLRGTDRLDDHEVENLLRLMCQEKRPRSRRDYAMIALILETGISVSRLIALSISSLDLKFGRSMVFNHSEPPIWIPIKQAVEPLRRYLDYARPELLHSRREKAFFITHNGHRMSRQGVWQVLRRWGQNAGLPYSLSPRLLRNTAVWRMVQADYRIEDIQHRLGHRSLLATRMLIQRLNLHVAS